MGKERYPNATNLMITVDGGGGVMAYRTPFFSRGKNSLKIDFTISSISENIL